MAVIQFEVIERIPTSEYEDGPIFYTTLDDLLSESKGRMRSILQKHRLKGYMVSYQDGVLLVLKYFTVRGTLS